MNDFFKNVTIVGMGLMGGSLGKAIISRFNDVKVTGVVRRAEMIDSVLSRKAAHKCTTDLQKGISDADLVVLSMPVEVICQYGQKILPYLKDSAVVTDMGSTKTKIVEILSGVLGDKAFFIGSHPMAGSEKTGLENSYPGLYEDSICIITPVDKSPLYLVEKLKKFWENTGCRVVLLPPDVHDSLISAVSHVPHLIAAVLVNTASKIKSGGYTSLDFAGAGFKDTTRVASGSPEMWDDICITNKINIADQLQMVEIAIREIRKNILNENKDAILEFLTQAKRIRDLLIKNHGNRK